MTLTAFLAAWFLHLIAAASPGPTILMSARIGVTEGMRAGVYYSIGCAIGAVLWAVTALFGLAVLFQIAPTLLWGFKLAGGLFLLWIALQMWRHAPDPLPEARAEVTPRTPLSTVLFGITTQLANPKPAIFFGAVFVGTIPPDTSVWVVAALLLVIFANEAFCTTAVARIFSFERSRQVYRRLKLRIDRVFGGLLAVLGIKVAIT